MQAQVPHSTLRHSASLRESPSEKANVGEDTCGLGTAIPYHGQPLQLRQNAAVMLGPQQVLAQNTQLQKQP